MDCNVHNRYISTTSQITEFTDFNQVDGFVNQAVTVKVAKYFNFGVNLVFDLHVDGLFNTID